MSHIARRYSFVYYVSDDNGQVVRKLYSVESNRFSKAFHSFVRFFNDLKPYKSYKDFSLSYYISDLSSVVNDYDYCREIPSKYFGYLFRSVPEV